MEAHGRPIEGWFHVLWVDPAPGHGPDTPRYELVDGRGHGTELELSPGVADRWGGPRGLDRRKVRVEGSPVADGRIRVGSINPASRVTPAQDPGWGTVQTGPHPFVTILCKFSDIATEPFPIATYKQWTTGTTYPSLDHYWRELSYNQMDVSGSILVGWYTLPHPLSYYSTATRWDPNGLARDCTGAADPDVDFPRFWGINLQVNGDIGGSGGGSWTLTADGQTKTYGMTWLYPWNSMADYAHEDGHALGMMHSGSSTGRGSWWDIMSSATPQGPQHTISYHKDVLGWIATARKYTVAPNTSQTITLARLALPGPGNYLMAQIPMDNAPGQFYTVEARQRVGYDKYLPGDAVVLHQVDPNRHPCVGCGLDLLAQVVDADHNGNLNDAGAMWTPGETFRDSANAITVAVNAQTATGFQVTITRGAVGAWSSRAAMPTARRALAAAVDNGTVYVIGGANGSGTVLRTVEAYSPAGNGWTTKAPLPAARQGGNGAGTIKGIVYLAGGEDAAGALTRTLYAYNTGTNAWKTLAPMPAYGACGGSAVIAARLYVFSGCTRSGTGAQVNARLLHRYNPTTNSWTTLAPAPLTHFRPVVAAIDGKLYVAGGNSGSGTTLRRVDVYDPATNTWSTRSGMRSPRMNAGAAALGGKLYVVGGRTGTTYLNTVEVYDPVSDAWTSRPAMPTARAALGVGTAGGLIYAIGGRNAASALATNERLTP
jgi:M6 family metalloprotease-like protein